jgi:LPS sulfotransferase NodH
MPSTTLEPTMRRSALRVRDESAPPAPALAPTPEREAAPAEPAAPPAAAAPASDRAAATDPATPSAVADAARAACLTRDLEPLAAAAGRAVPLHAPNTPAATLLALLAGARPAALPAPAEETTWLLQRIDGSLVAIVRLRANGEVAHATHANESRWTHRDGKLVLADAGGKPTTTFALAAKSGGKAVHVGLFTDGQTVHVLSEVDCAYSRLRLLDPELVGACAGVVDPAQLAPVELPPVPAVILAAPRTGSHLLLNLLNSSGRVFFDAELFNEERISVFGHDIRHETAGMLHFVREHDPAYFARTMLTRSHHVDGRRLDGYAVRGFKLFAKHSKTALDWAFDEPRMRIVHLHRANLLAEYSSLLVAYADGHWVGGPASLKTRRVAFDATRFMRFVDMKRHYLAHVRERLARRAGPSIEIEYADFSRRRVNEVLAFLLDAPQDLHFDALGLKRQLAGRVIDRFENPGDVLRALRAMNCEDWAEAEGQDVAAL